MTSEKGKEKERDPGTEGKALTPTQAVDALKEQKGRNLERANPVTLDHLVASYDPQGLYKDPILKHPSTRRWSKKKVNE